MVEPIPLWAKVAVALVVAALALPIVLWLVHEEAPLAAYWHVDPAVALEPTDREIPILVNERSCASGHSAEGRIVVDVAYTVDEVRLDVRVRPREGDQDCQGNPDTPYEVDLREPLGGREVSGESSRPITRSSA